MSASPDETTLIEATMTKAINILVARTDGWTYTMGQMEPVDFADEREKRIYSLQRDQALDLFDKIATYEAMQSSLANKMPPEISSGIYSSVSDSARISERSIELLYASVDFENGATASEVEIYSTDGGIETIYSLHKTLDGNLRATEESDIRYADDDVVKAATKLTPYEDVRRIVSQLLVGITPRNEIDVTIDYLLSLPGIVSPETAEVFRRKAYSVHDSRDFTMAIGNDSTMSFKQLNDLNALLGRLL